VVEEVVEVEVVVVVEEEVVGDNFICDYPRGRGLRCDGDRLHSWGEQSLNWGLVIWADRRPASRALR